MFRKRNRIAMFFLLEILQVIYLFYWQCSVQNEVRRATQHGVGGADSIFKHNYSGNLCNCMAMENL